jgi:hypothetical protein
MTRESGLGFGTAQTGFALRGPVLADLLTLPPVASGAMENVVREGAPAVNQNARRCILHVVAADEETLLAVRAFHDEGTFVFDVGVSHLALEHHLQPYPIGRVWRGNGTGVVRRGASEGPVISG